MPPPHTPTRGGSRIFIFRGAQRIIVAARTLRTENRTHIRQGSRARVRALGALGLF